MLRLNTIVVSRPQRQGSSINSPTKVGLPLTLLPARTLPVCLPNVLTTPTTLYTANRTDVSTALVWFLRYAGTWEKDWFGASQKLVQGFRALSVREGRWF